MTKAVEPIEWHFWSAEQLVDSLPGLLDTVESRLAEFPDEHRDKNRAAVESLRAAPPTPAQVREGARSRDLVTLGFALDVLGRRSASQGDAEEALRLFQAAHELFRGGNPLLRATRPMRQSLGNALRVLISREIARVRDGETTLATVREALEALITSAWGFVPAQFALTMNETLLGELERVRAAAEDDPAFQERLVRENIEAVLGLEIPTRLEPVRRQWEAAGERVAPTVARRAHRALRRPEPLGSLLPAPVWTALQQAVERGDAEALGQALGEVEDLLDANLRLRLDAKPDYREPVAELRLTGMPDPAFVEARAALLRQDPRALELFSTIHYRRSGNTVAKEWYAYALAVFGRPTDVHDIIELLEAAVASEHYRPERGWTARWNLACALRRLPSRAAEALDVLLPVLELDAHSAEAFELGLLWALEQDRRDLLPGLLLRCRHYEAHLLAALRDAEALREGASPASFRDHFRRLNRILRDPDRVFPDPRERLTFDELDRLTREFIESSLVAAGIEWFRQRVSYGHEGRVFKNWECAALLTEEAGDLAATWRCRQQSWRSTQHKKNVDPRKKTQVLRGLLTWGLRHDFRDDALRLLRQGWRDTSMTEADARLWEQRLSRRAAAGEGEARPAEPAPDPVAEPPREEPREGSNDTSGAAGPGAARPRRPVPVAARPPLALMLDWENIKISLREVLDGLPEARAQALRPRLSGPELAARLLEAAWRHGTPRQRWAVADWDRPFFEGDQKALRNARYWSDIAGTEKFNASDHVLREKIHFVLREHPEIQVYVIGTGDADFLEAIRTLQQQGKQVILWSTRRAINAVYGEALRGPDAIRIEWLEDLVFGPEALREE